MIDTLLALLNSIIGALNSIKKGQRERFNTLITPLMERLTAIHKDYILMFEEVTLELRQPTNNIETTIASFAKARAKLHPDRIAFRHAVEVANASPKVEPFRPFMDSLLAWLLAFSYQQGDNSLSSHFYSILEQAATTGNLDQLNASSVRDDLAYQAEANIEELRTTWSSLSRSYELLKVNLAV